jgi:hypothetical protein
MHADLIVNAVGNLKFPQVAITKEEYAKGSTGKPLRIFGYFVSRTSK